jgi:hypothetical protein
MNPTTDQISHREYLKSSTWKNIRMAALDHYGRVCAKCNQYGTDVHHLLYPSVQGEESMEDLMVLCRSCHEAIHSAQRGCSFSDSIHINGLFNYLTEKQREILSLNLSSSLYCVFMSDTNEGERVRQIALKMLDIRRYYGLKKDHEKKMLSLKESRKIQNSKQKMNLQHQNKYKKLLEESNPRLYGFKK